MKNCILGNFRNNSKNWKRMSDSKIKFNKVKNKVVLACLIIQELNEWPVRRSPSRVVTTLLSVNSQSEPWSFWWKIFILVYYYPAIDVSFEPDYTSTKLSKNSLLSTVKKKARDLLHPILDGCSPLNEDIDLVYTWVNGSEIAFKEWAHYNILSFASFRSHDCLGTIGRPWILIKNIWATKTVNHPSEDFENYPRN